MTRADLNAICIWAGDLRIDAAGLVHRAGGDDDLRRRLAAVTVAATRLHDLAVERLAEQVVTPIRKAGGK